MVFAAPYALLGLIVLPLLWWLLRASPPAPRTQDFPAIRLLEGLPRTEETAAVTPWWLLALRLLAAALLVLGLARPVLGGRPEVFTASGPVLLVLDTGWAAASDWDERLGAAQAVLDRAEAAGRRVALLATAHDEADAPPHATPPMTAPELRPLLGALHPLPWGVDRASAAAAIRAAPPGPAFYIADGLATEADPAFAAALAAHGPVTEIRAEMPRLRLLLPPRPAADALWLRVARLPLPVPEQAQVQAETGDGRVLARTTVTLPEGAGTGEAPVALPLELRNQLARLTLEGGAGAGAVALLDESARRHPVGLLAGEEAGAQTPLTGPLFYLDRALAPETELRTGDIPALLARPVSVLVLADRPVSEAEAETLRHWVEQGGLLVRFAGPRTAEAGDDDPLLPVRLLDGDRQLGGSMSWSKPAGLAPFPPESPFAGLAVPEEVTVRRQVLAEPSAGLAAHSWARLADGTPLVTEAALGQGRIVLFHVTANADWSNLPLSGLFVDMLRRLVRLSAGVHAGDAAALLAPAQTLDGAGMLGPPPQAARGLAARDFATTPVSPRHPPGLYGKAEERRALNIGTAQPPLVAAASIPGAAERTLHGAARERALGPALLAAALLLLLLDLLASLFVRGLLRPAATAALLLLLLLLPLAPARAAESPALATHLAYVLSGDEQVDGVARAGLAGLSAYVNRRTAAVLADPVGVTPGEDDLSFYPLLYWPVTEGTAPGPRAVAALNDYMAHGGIILIDTRGGDAGESGSGAGMAPGAGAALRRAARGLQVPPLAPLTADHVLARSFYLLPAFPGRYDGGTVWVQRDQDRSNDSVSPVIIGTNDWAAAWATDEAGANPYAAIPGGERQRTLAYRFGVNLVMYALTGNYKGDQVHVPAILERLGQ